MAYVITYFLKQGWNLPTFWTGKNRIHVGHKEEAPWNTGQFEKAKKFDSTIEARMALNKFKSQIANPNDGTEWKIEWWTQESFEKWYDDADERTLQNRRDNGLFTCPNCEWVESGEYTCPRCYIRVTYDNALMVGSYKQAKLPTAPRRDINDTNDDQPHAALTGSELTGEC